MKQYKGWSFLEENETEQIELLFYSSLNCGKLTLAILPLSISEAQK